MKKAKTIFLTVVCLLIIGLVVAVILARSLKFNPAFFTPEYQAKYATPEAAFEGIWKSHIGGDRKLYEAVLGHDWPGDTWTPSSTITRPEIEWVDIDKTHAYIKAAGWGGSFEKLGGRWVFQNEEFGFFCRQFFRLFGIELARFQ
jgi:ABC-type sugar transport system permease subunit